MDGKLRTLNRSRALGNALRSPWECQEEHVEKQRPSTCRRIPFNRDHEGLKIYFQLNAAFPTRNEVKREFSAACCTAWRLWTRHLPSPRAYCGVEANHIAPHPLSMSSNRQLPSIASFRVDRYVHVHLVQEVAFALRSRSSARVARFHR